MRKMQAVLTSFALLGTVATAQALTIVVPLDKASWYRQPTFVGGIDYNLVDSVTNDALTGDLILKKLAATGGTNWFIGRDTVATYDLQDATLQYQWKLNGQGTYAGTYNGVQTKDHGGLAYNRLTTGWVYSSILIPSNTWMYTEYAFSHAGSSYKLDWAISKVKYGDTDVAHGSTTLGAAAWTALATARPFVWVGDNYAANAYFELASMTINAVPEPETYALMLAGLLAVATVARRRMA